MSVACPICGDPRAYPFWVTKEPPEGCPEDTTWHRGGPVTIRTITECPYQMKKARQQAEFRRLAPESFDAFGNIIPGQIAHVLEVFARHHPNEAIVP